MLVIDLIWLEKCHEDGSWSSGESMFIYRNLFISQNLLRRVRQAISHTTGFKTVPQMLLLFPIASNIALTIHSVVNDDGPLPPKASTEEDDELLFADDPWIDSPIKVDYGINLRYT